MARWKSPKASGKKGPKSSMFATIDHILFQRKFINSLIDCKTFGSFTDISDHTVTSQKEGSVFNYPLGQRVSFIAQIIYST